MGTILLVITFYQGKYTFISITRSRPWLAKRSKFGRRKNQVGNSGCVCIMGYENLAQPLCCKRWYPGWVHTTMRPKRISPAFAHLDFHRGWHGLLGTWPEPSGVSVASQGHWVDVSLPFLCSLPERNLSVWMPPP